MRRSAVREAERRLKVEQQEARAEGEELVHRLDLRKHVVEDGARLREGSERVPSRLRSNPSLGGARRCALPYCLSWYSTTALLYASSDGSASPTRSLPIESDASAFSRAWRRRGRRR